MGIEDTGTDEEAVVDVSDDMELFVHITSIFPGAKQYLSPGADILRSKAQV